MFTLADITRDIDNMKEELERATKAGDISEEDIKTIKDFLEIAEQFRDLHDANGNMLDPVRGDELILKVMNMAVKVSMVFGDTEEQALEGVKMSVQRADIRVLQHYSRVHEQKIVNLEAQVAALIGFIEGLKTKKDV